MKTTLFALLLAASASLTAFAGPRVTIGVGVGVPAYVPPPAPVVAYQPPCPGPGYVWTAGYWSSDGPRRFWVPGVWTAPVLRGSFYREHEREHFVEPRHFERSESRGFRR